MKPMEGVKRLCRKCRKWLDLVAFDNSPVPNMCWVCSKYPEARDD